MFSITLQLVNDRLVRDDVALRSMLFADIMYVSLCFSRHMAAVVTYCTRLKHTLLRVVLDFIQHGKTGMAPWNRIPDEEVCTVVSCIESYASLYGLPQPAAPRGHN